jgi:MYXO-CTERM domain-containing protein
MGSGAAGPRLAGLGLLLLVAIARRRGARGYRLPR